MTEKPRAAITAKVPISDTGMAMIGMIEARQVCRNTITTSTTRATASKMVLISSWMDSAMKSVGL